MRLNDIIKDIDVLEIKGNCTCDIINFHFDSRLISKNDMMNRGSPIKKKRDMIGGITH